MRRLVLLTPVFKESGDLQRHAKPGPTSMTSVFSSFQMQMIMCDLRSSLSISHQELEKQIVSLEGKLDEVTRLLSALVQSKQQEEQQVH